MAETAALTPAAPAAPAPAPTPAPTPASAKPEGWMALKTSDALAKAGEFKTRVYMYLSFCIVGILVLMMLWSTLGRAAPPEGVAKPGDAGAFMQGLLLTLLPAVVAWGSHWLARNWKPWAVFVGFV